MTGIDRVLGRIDGVDGLMEIAHQSPSASPAPESGCMYIQIVREQDAHVHVHVHVHVHAHVTCDMCDVGAV